MLVAAAAEAGAFALSPQSRDTALLLRLEPGSYTALLSSAASGAGLALIELYRLDD